MLSLLTVLRLWAVLILGLQLLAYLLPPERAWSLWPYTFLPPWLGWLLALGTALLLIPSLNQRFQDQLTRLWQRLPGKNHPRRWFLILSLLSLPLFCWGRIRHLQWGDAAVLNSLLSHPEQPVIYNWQAPLTVFLHQRLWALVAHPLLGWEVAQVYAAVSIVCGGFFVYLILSLAHQLGRTTPERSLIAGMVLSCGAMVLFFGYVENYTLISLGLMVVLWAGLQVLRAEWSLWTATLALAVTNAFHPSTIVLWPAVLYLAWQRYRGRQSPVSLLLSLGLPPLVVLNSLLTMMELGNHGLTALLGVDRPGGSDGVWLVPLFETSTRWEHYTMFSLPHLLDWGNEQLLLSVFGLFTLVVVGLWNRIERSEPAIPAAQLTFLELAAAGYLLLTWVWNADYGIRRDWDLFAPAAFVYSLPAALLLIGALKRQARIAQASLFILAVSILHTAAWVYANTRPLVLPTIIPWG